MQKSTRRTALLFFLFFLTRNLPAQDTWSFTPERDSFSPQALFDLRSLNEPSAGQKSENPS